MPTNRRRKPRQRRLSHRCPWLWEHLRTGDSFEVELGEVTITEDQLREAWEQLRERVLAEHIAEQPGTRPWAWWQWDAPEPRRKLDPGPESSWPCRWHGYPLVYGPVRPEDQYEAEVDYLRRLGLLTEDEKRLLDPSRTT